MKNAPLDLYALAPDPRLADNRYRACGIDFVTGGQIHPLKAPTTKVTCCSGRRRWPSGRDAPTLSERV